MKSYLIGLAQLQIEARLRKFQEKSRQRLDWAKFREVALQATGIPVPISAPGHEGGDAATKIVEVERVCVHLQ